MVLCGCVGYSWSKLQHFHALLDFVWIQTSVLKNKTKENPNMSKACVLREMDCVCSLASCCASLPVGALRVEFFQPVNLEEVARLNPAVKAGGRFAPKNCIALQKVAIIIPFRNREEHLKYWLYYLHPILQRQQLDYGVYVINQVRC